MRPTDQVGWSHGCLFLAGAWRLKYALDCLHLVTRLPAATDHQQKRSRYSEGSRVTPLNSSAEAPLGPSPRTIKTCCCLSFVHQPPLAVAAGGNLNFLAVCPSDSSCGIRIALLIYRGGCCGLASWLHTPARRLPAPFVLSKVGKLCSCNGIASKTLSPHPPRSPPRAS